MKITSFTEIEPLIKNLTDFKGELLYTKEYSDTDFFVLYENDAVLEKLPLDNFCEDKFIEGYIFKKSLEVTKAVTTYDKDHSPFLVVLGNVKAAGMVLAGNAHYIDGNLDCGQVWGFYNHGSLTVNGSSKMGILYSDDFTFEFGSLESTAFVLGDEKAKYKDANGNRGGVLITRSHSLSQVFNVAGKKLCKSGELFQVLIADDDQHPPITHTKFDFYEDFGKKSRAVFNKIFSHPLFDEDETVYVSKAGLSYSFSIRSTDTFSVAITTDKYIVAIVFQTTGDYMALNLSLIEEGTYDQFQYEFIMEEEEDFFQAKTVKHWFFEAEKEWNMHVKKVKKMSISTHEFIEQLKTKPASAFKMPFKNGTEKIFDLIHKPNELYLFLDEYLDVFKEGSELFHYAVDFIARESDPLMEKLVNKAFAMVAKEENANAHYTLLRANLFIPEIFHTRLQNYFAENPNALIDDNCYPWRGADMVYVQPFKHKITDTTTSIAEKERYFNCLYYSTQQHKERNGLIEKLQQQSFEPAVIERIRTFYPKQGFDFPSEDDWMYKKIKGSSLLPIFYDNANHICVYIKGKLKGKVCEWHHEESDFTPMWRSIDSLLTHIENEPECDDWIRLSRDYPLTDETFTKEDETILNELHKTYNSVKDAEEDFENDNSQQNKDYSLKVQTVYTICEFTPPKKVADIVPFLEDKDMFVLERVISTLGDHKYYAVKDKLLEIVKTTNGNQKMAAESVLEDWEDEG